MQLSLEQALRKGIRAHKAGRVQEADKYYTGILKVIPKHPHANHNMGVLAVSIGRVKEALPFFKIALEANPNLDQFWLSYIETLIKLERLNDARTVFSEAKKKKPTFNHPRCRGRSSTCHMSHPTPPHQCLCLPLDPILKHQSPPTLHNGMAHEEQKDQVA